MTKVHFAMRVAGTLAVISLLTLAPTQAPAAAAGSVRIDAKVNGRDVIGAAGNRPLRLRGDRPAIVEVDVFNHGSKPLKVRSIRLSGRVLGLTFFSYETRVDMEVAPGASDQRHYALDLNDLAGQANGLLPSRIAVLGQDRQELVGQPFVAEVDGSLGSVYGLFGLGVAAITALLLGGAIFRLATGRLPANRWKRGVRFGTAGLGLGLTATFSMSAMRILVPAPSRSLGLALGSGAVLFVLGYLSPTPERGDAGQDRDIDLTRRFTPVLQEPEPVTPGSR